jgi:hypothetical protein
VHIFICCLISSAICSSCVRGECVAPDVCKCAPGFTGANCSVCLPGYTGSNCDQCWNLYFSGNSLLLVTCSSDCGRGYCSAPNTCTCDPNFANANNNPSLTCNVPICTPACQNGGVCTSYGSTNQCRCNYLDWTGPTCTQRHCGTYCSFHGFCREGVFVFVIFCWTEKAAASATSAGRERIVKTVGSAFSDLILMLTAVCSGGCLGSGFCSAPGTCSCFQGYSGSNCQGCRRFFLQLRT